MLNNGRRIYMLAEYTVEHKKDGWHFWRLHTTKTAGLSHAREHGELYYGVA